MSMGWRKKPFHGPVAFVAAASVMVCGVVGCGAVGAATEIGDAGDAAPLQTTADDAAPDGWSFVDAGAYEASAADGAPSDGGVDADAARVCITEFTGVGTADFHVTFKLQTTTTGLTTLVYQRGVCAHSEFWDIHVMPNGTLGVETDNSGMHYTAMTSAQKVNDGVLHAIDVSRVDRVITITIDGVPSGTASSLTNFGVLPPLGTVAGNPCEKGFGQIALVGTLTELCLSGP